jgi:hypothetical protein
MESERVVQCDTKELYVVRQWNNSTSNVYTGQIQCSVALLCPQKYRFRFFRI